MSPTVEKLLLVGGLAFPLLLALVVMPQFVDVGGLFGGGPRTEVRGAATRVAAHQLDQALTFWSARMQAAYPPAQNLYNRFARTASVELRRNALVGQDDAAGTAEVSVDVAETLNSGGGRHYVGTWSLVRGP